MPSGMLSELLKAELKKAESIKFLGCTYAYVDGQVSKNAFLDH